ILLVIISIFLLIHFHTNKLISVNRVSSAGLVLTVSGVYINELILGVQGVASLSYLVVPHVNGLLFSASIIVFSGITLLIIGQFVKPRIY
ncbi:MAG: hypothetical protein ACKVQB_13730, partial [Bacteroidia bacterium]